MTLDDVKEIIRDCNRHELVDKYFGDKEIRWTTDKGDVVAEAYVGKEYEFNYDYCGELYSTNSFKIVRELIKLGKSVSSARNDNQGNEH